MLLTVAATGSTSARLTWDPTLAPSSSFQVYRGVTSSFGSAATVGAPQAPGTALYNDYGPLTPGTTYYYWIKDSGSPVGGVAITTQAAVVDADALDETQMNALYDWAYGVYNGLFPVEWRYQPMVQQTKPKIILNALLVRSPGLTDDIRDAGESLIGARIATISVNVSTDPQPPVRKGLTPTDTVAGDYVVTVDTVDFTVNFAAEPATITEVSTAVLAALVEAGYQGFLYGVDPDVQSVALSSADPRADFTVSAGSNMSVATISTPKAMTIAQRLKSSLGANLWRDPLSAAGIGVGTVNDVNDLSAALETRFELRAQFDFYINLASVLGISGPIIDTVASVDGTITN